MNYELSSKRKKKRLDCYSYKTSLVAINLTEWPFEEVKFCKPLSVEWGNVRKMYRKSNCI